MTTPNSNVRGANFTVYDHAGNNFLRTYAWVNPTAMSTYTNLGRAIRSFGGQLTEEDSFEFRFDVMDVSGSNTYNGTIFGLQEATGPDDGTREGFGVFVVDTHAPATEPVDLVTCDLTSFKYAGWVGGYNFMTNSGNWKCSFDQEGAFDEVRLTYDGTMKRILAKVYSNDIPVAFIPPLGYPRTFTLENLVAVQGTGSSGSKESVVDVDNLCITELRPNLFEVDDFSSFANTPVLVTTNPPGTWTTNGTICSPPDSGHGGSFVVTNSGGDNYLHAFSDVNGVNITAYTNLGRAVRSLGTSVTTNDAFTLIVDIAGHEVSSGIRNNIVFGLQEGGTDDGTREGLALGYDAAEILWIQDLSVFSGGNFGFIIGGYLSAATLDQVRLTYDNEMGDGNVLVEVVNNDVITAWTNLTYSTDFVFENFIVSQGTGNDGAAGPMSLDIDNVRLIKGYASAAPEGSMIVVR